MKHVLAVLAGIGALVTLALSMILPKRKRDTLKVDTERREALDALGKQSREAEERQDERQKQAIQESVNSDESGASRLVRRHRDAVAKAERDGEPDTD